MRLPRRPRPSTTSPASSPEPDHRRRLAGRTVATLAGTTAFGVAVALVGPGVPLVAGGAEADDESVRSGRPTAVASAFDEPAAIDRAQGVQAVRITVRGEEREETIPAPVELRENDVLPLGELRVDEEGVDGFRHEIVEVILRNGVAVDERVVAANERPPEPTIASVGTSTSDAATRNWAALAQCESGGDPTIVSRSGRYHGLYQFDRPTWESVGGTGLPSEASPDEQRRRAIALYEQRGASPWPTCGRHL